MYNFTGMNLFLPVFSYTFQNKSTTDTLDVFIDGEIVDAQTEQLLKDYFGDDTSISYKTFRNKVEAVNPKILNIILNCPGGHAGDSLAMHDYLKDLQQKGTIVNVYVRGMSASAGTYFQMAVPVENRYASANSFSIIHNVSGGVAGDLRTLQNYVTMAEKVNKNIVNLYVSNTKLTHQKVTDMMDSETMLTAQEMLDYGFIGNITSNVPLKNTLDISKLCFKNTAVLNAYNSFIKNSNSSNMDIKKVTDAIENCFNKFIEKLGIKDKATDENVKNAFTDFSASITNAISDGLKNIVVPTEESIQNMVNAALTAAMDKIGDNENIKNAITAATKDAVTKKDLKDLETTLTNAIADKMGNKSQAGEDEDDKSKGKKNTSRKVHNRFVGTYSEYNN